MNKEKTKVKMKEVDGNEISNKVEENDITTNVEENDATTNVEANNSESPVDADKVDENKEVLEKDKLIADLAETKDKYLRLYSEFDNYRRRTSKEKLELISTANQELISALIPIIDDFERAESSFDEKADAKTISEGVKLISNKFNGILEQKGLKAMKSDAGIKFDPEIHEAITQIPAPTKKLKGKVVDVIEKGYFLGEKVIRFAKVVTGK